MQISTKVKGQGGILLEHPETAISKDATPGIFTLADGTAAAIREDGVIVSKAIPVRAGSIVSLFATGLGAVDTPFNFGTAATTPTLLRNPVTVTIGGKPAEVLYSGTSPGQTTGLIQINVRVPDGVTGDAGVEIASQGESSAPHQKAILPVQ